MNEKDLSIVLEALAKTIESLRTEVQILKYEKKKLEEELEIFKAPRVCEKNGGKEQ